MCWHYNSVLLHEALRTHGHCCLFSLSADPSRPNEDRVKGDDVPLLAVAGGAGAAVAVIVIAIVIAVVVRCRSMVKMIIIRC